MYIVRYLIDSIFPPSANEALLQQWTKEEFSHLLAPTVLFDKSVVLGPYYHHSLKAAIQATKFEQSIWGATLLSELFSTYYNSLPAQKTLLIPIPLSGPRERKRGFNQVTRVLEYSTKHTDSCLVNTKILYRTKDVAPQTSLNRANRLKNVVDIFAVRPKLLANIITTHDIQRVIICDDVYTTGATLAEARAMLAPQLPHHIKLLCVAWAH